jgi:hypothetical protein
VGNGVRGAYNPTADEYVRAKELTSRIMAIIVTHTYRAPTHDMGQYSITL